MFYAKFVKLCKAKGMSPAAVAKDVGLSNSCTTTWKRGSMPKGDTLQKLADYFHVSVDYLLGKSDNPHPDKAGRTERFSPWTMTDEVLFKLGGFQALAEFSFLSDADKAEALKDINKFIEFTLSKYTQREQAKDDPQHTPSATSSTDTTPPPDAPETPPEGK